MAAWQESTGPLGFGAVLDAGFATFRRGFWQFVLALVLPVVLITFVNFVLLPVPVASANPALLIQHEVSQAPIRALTDLLGLVQLGVGIEIAHQIYGGSRPDVAKAYRLVLRRFPVLLVTSILFFLALLVGFIVLIVPAILALVWFSLAPYVVLVEGQGPVQALAKSFTLVQGHFWRVLGVYLVAFLLVAVLSMLVMIPFGGGLAGFMIAAGGVQSLASNSHLAIALMAAIVNIAVGAFPTATLFVQYADLRIRKEGLDLGNKPAAI